MVTDRPHCFNSDEQFIEWVRLARSSHPGPGGYCTDCPPAYQARMIRERRCGYPGTLFVEVGEGEDKCLVGRRPKHKRWD